MWVQDLWSTARHAHIPVVLFLVRVFVGEIQLWFVLPADRSRREMVHLRPLSLSACRGRPRARFGPKASPGAVGWQMLDGVGLGVVAGCAGQSACCRGPPRTTGRSRFRAPAILQGRVQDHRLVTVFVNCLCVAVIVVVLCLFSRSPPDSILSGFGAVSLHMSRLPAVVAVAGFGWRITGATRRVRAIVARAVAPVRGFARGRLARLVLLREARSVQFLFGSLLGIRFRSPVCFRSPNLRRNASRRARVRCHFDNWRLLHCPETPIQFFCDVDCFLERRRSASVELLA